MHIIQYFFANWECDISNTFYSSAIYKPAGRINEAGLLRGMVEQCNSTLNMQMFPEEVTAVAAVLNRDHYKFK